MEVLKEKGFKSGYEWYKFLRSESVTEIEKGEYFKIND